MLFSIFLSILLANFASAQTSSQPSSPSLSQPPQQFLSAWTTKHTAQPATPLSTGHAWLLLPATLADGTLSPTLLDIIHILPRDGSPRATVGSVRIILPLSTPVEAIAAYDNRLYLLTAANAAPATAPSASTQPNRTLLSLSAKGPIAPGSWEYFPQGRLEYLPPLPTADDITSIAAGSLDSTTSGLLVITKSPAAVYTLWFLDQFGWHIIEQPAAIRSATTNAIELHAFSIAGRVHLAHRSAPQTLTLYEPSLEKAITTPKLDPKQPATTRPPLSPASILAVTWTPALPSILALPQAISQRPLQTVGRSATDTLLALDGQFVLATRTPQSPIGQTVDLYRLSPTQAPALLNLPNLGPAVATIGLSGIARLNILSLDSQTKVQPAPSSATETSPPIIMAPGSNRQPPPQTSILRPGSRLPSDAKRLTVHEVSLGSGEVLQTVQAKTDGLLSRQDFQFLWLAFLAIGAVTLIALLRADPMAAVVIPNNASLARPMRRIFAGLVDIIIPLLIVAQLTRISPLQIIFPTQSSSWLPQLMLLTLGFAQCALGELVAGKSIGKLFAGITVAGMRRSGSISPANQSDPSSQNQSSGPTQTSGPVWIATNPSPLQAIFRNLIKWFAPPIGLFFLFDPQWRHPGDMLVRTIVVQPKPDTSQDADNDIDP